MKGKLLKKAAVLVLALSLCAATVTGCSSSQNETNAAAQSGAQDETGASQESSSESDASEETEEVTENEPVNPDDVALDIDGVQILAPEVYYHYLAFRVQTEYSMGGMMDWSAAISSDGTTYGEYLKSLVENQVLQNAFWNSMAEEDGITLSDDDQEEIAENLASFNDSIADEDKALYGFNDETVTKALEHIAIAGKVLDAEVEKQIAQLTDEEKESCVFRTVQHILLKTEKTPETNESGETKEVSESEAESYRQSQKAKAEEVLERALAGEDFGTLADEYNEDSGFEYSLNRDGQSPDGVSYVQEFTDGAWKLAEGEMAIVETEYGYHVMKCVSENDEALGESALRELAVSKYNDTYQQWLNDNDATFYDGWQKFVVLNTPALPATEAAAAAAAEESGAADESAASDDSAADESAASDGSAADEGAADESAASESGASDTQGA